MTSRYRDRASENPPPARPLRHEGATITQPAEVLRAAGRPVDVVPVPGAEHAFDDVSSITSRTTAAVIRDWLLRTVAPSS